MSLSNWNGTIVGPMGVIIIILRKNKKMEEKKKVFLPIKI